MSAQTFRKKPVEIQAVRYTGENPMEVADFMDHAGFTLGGMSGALVIHTLEGEMRVSDGDWVIRGVAGEFYPCKPDIFEATYELVEP